MTATPDGRNILDVILCNPLTGVAYTASGGGGGGSSLAETLWTDDTGAFYVREDNGATVGWYTPLGVAITSFAPGANLRPADGASMLMDSTRYQATAVGTGIAVGDYLSHIVTIDPATGQPLANFWVNASQSTKLTTLPVPANISPINPLPVNAAQESSGNLASIAAYLTGKLPFNLSQINGLAVSATNGIPIYDAYMAPQAVTWPYGTTTGTVNSVNTQGMDTVIVTLVTNSTTLGGAVVFEVWDGAAWLIVKAASILDYSTTGTSIPLTSSMSKGYQVPVAGFPTFRVRLSTLLSPAGASLTNTIIVSSAPDTSILTVGLDPAAPLPVGTNAIGLVNQALATPGFAKLTDGTTAVAIKAASVAPVATDPALVVSMSPNNDAIFGAGLTVATLNTAFSGTGFTSSVVNAISTAGFAKLCLTVTTAGVVNMYVRGSNDGTNWTNLLVYTVSSTLIGPNILNVPSILGTIFEVECSHAFIQVYSGPFTSAPTLSWCLKTTPLVQPNSLLNGGFVSNYKLQTALGTDNALLIFTNARRVVKVTGYNAAATVRYLKLYNKATTPASTDTPIWTEALLPTSKFELNFGDITLYCSLGLGYRITTGFLDNDTGALTAGDILALNIGYV